MVDPFPQAASKSLNVQNEVWPMKIDNLPSGEITWISDITSQVSKPQHGLEISLKDWYVFPLACRPVSHHAVIPRSEETAQGSGLSGICWSVYNLTMCVSVFCIGFDRQHRWACTLIHRLCFFLLTYFPQTCEMEQRTRGNDAHKNVIEWSRYKITPGPIQANLPCFT